MESKTIIKISNVSFAFKNISGKSDWALRDVSFDVKPGEFLSIVGPSGCGKSTLLRAVSSLITPNDGLIERNFKKLAMVFQNFALFPWLSVEKNVAFGIAMDGMNKRKRHHIAAEKIAEVGLSGFEKKYPKELSGGERQRVGLARALAVKPDLLLMDEPFSSLDSFIAGKLKKDVAALWEKYRMTVVMVNHLISDSVELSDRIVVMSGSPGMVKAIITVNIPRPRNPRSPEFFALQDKITKLIEL